MFSDMKSFLGSCASTTLFDGGVGGVSWQEGGYDTSFEGAALFMSEDSESSSVV